ncbi:unnamed protein product [Malus baccata var. baccata]
MPVISAKLSVHETGADKAERAGASSISEAPSSADFYRRCPSDRRFDLNLVEEAATPSPDNIWHPSFLSPTGLLTVGDSVMKNDMTAAVVARNLLTTKDNRLLSKRSDELAIKDSLALSVQCRKLDQMKESDGQILLDHQRFVGLFQRHLLPSSSRAIPRNEAPNDQPLMPHPSRVLSSTDTPNDPPLVPPLSGALPIAETSPKQSL